MTFTDVLPSRWPVFLSLFLQKTVLSSWLVPGLIFMNLPRPYVFIPGLSLLFWSPCVCVPASSSLWWLLQGRDVVKSERKMPPAVFFFLSLLGPLRSCSILAAY